MRLIDADKDPCNGCKMRPFCGGMCAERINWYKETVDPVKHGHWVLNGDPRDKWYNCSVCGKHGYDKITNYGCNIETILSDYCPHCGAKMDDVFPCKTKRE